VLAYLRKGETSAGFGIGTATAWAMQRVHACGQAVPALYSSSISLSAACSGERHAVVGSGGLNAASRSMAVR